MLKTLKLLLPALIPSWRFFDVIAPSPRIEFVLLKDVADTTEAWQEFRPRPEHLSIATKLKRMVWNPQWNESLFLVSCAEGLSEHPAAHREQEIVQRIRADLARHSVTAPAYVRFRLVFVSREDVKLHKQVTFISPVYPYAEEARE